MKNQSLLYGIIGLIAGYLIGTYIPSNTSFGSMMGRSNYGNNNQYGMMGNSSTIDSHFIEQMIPHHEDAITMAELARTKATKQEINDLAENIITSQTYEITNMKQWYKDWYGKDVPQNEEVMGGHGMMGSGGMHMGMLGNETDISKLENATDFDKAFIEEMIPHHQMAVMMANMLRNGTQKQEMKQLADDITTAQTKEIEEMRTWYNARYK